MSRVNYTISGYILGLHSKQHSFLGLTCIRKAEGKKGEGKKAGVKFLLKRREVKVVQPYVYDSTQR